MNFTKKFAVYNIIFGSIFSLVFGGIGIFGFICLNDSHNGFQITNSIFTITIGILGFLDGLKTGVKGYRFINSDKSVISKVGQDKKN